MIENYIVYLGIIVIIMLFLCGIAIYLIMRKANNLRRKYANEIDCGNISVFFDSKRNVTIIPYVSNDRGVGRAVDEPKFLKSPYKDKQLGIAVKQCMLLCKTGSTCEDADLIMKLEGKGWKDFSEGKKNISIYYNEKHSKLALNATIRKVDGSYYFRSKNPDALISTDTADDELGRVIMSILTRCI